MNRTPAPSVNRSGRWLQILGLGALATGLPGLDVGAPLSWLSAGLLLLAGLKLAEARSLPEQRLVSLLTLIGCGVQGAQQAELLPSLLQLLATSLTLAGLLALELGTGLSWRAVLRRSLAVLLAALPVALVLFLLVPRIGPLWPTSGLRGPGAQAVTGLSAVLDPGSIASLANDSAPAARVSFSEAMPPNPAERYWRVIVHERFDGQRWRWLDPTAADGRPAESPPAGAPSRSNGASQVWLVEPSPINALPWAGRGLANRTQLRVSPNGELQLQAASLERQAYLLRGTDAPQAWQKRPPSAADLVLPAGTNPQLEALGARWRQLPTPQQRLAAAEAWFSSQGFRYSRTPGALPSRRGLDVFLFERREGFCGHYASAFTALMRAAGVPARVVSGYLGGTWVEPLGAAPYLDLRHSDAHAWSEVWLPGQGWQRVDPTGWAGASDSVANTPARNASQPSSWLQWLQWQWWGLDLAWSRWWLGFDQASQEALLQRLFGDQRHWLGAVVLGSVAALLALGLGGLRWLQGPARPKKRRRQLNRALKHLEQQGLHLEPGESLDSLARRAREERFSQADLLNELAANYNQLLFARMTPHQRRQAETRWNQLLKGLGVNQLKAL